jgi:glycosyltransferase involved in cell wall biosynthesis
MVNSKLKIGLLTDNYPGSGGVGGIGTYTRSVAEELVKLGHEVHVFTGANVKKLKTRICCGATVWECPRWGQRRDMPLKNAIEFTVRFKANAEVLDRYVMMTAVRQAAQSKAFDVIESPEFSALAGLIDRKKYARRLAVRLHGSSSQWRPAGDTGALRPMDQAERALALAADVLTVPTIISRQTAAQFWNCSLDRAIVIGNPVRNGVAPNFKGPSVCSGVYFGRLEPRKGVDTIAAAIGPVRKRFPNFKLHFIGTDNWWPDGTKSSEIIRRIAASTGGEGGYEIHPSRFDGDLVAAAQNASFCVFPSRAESFGLVMLEAMAWGIPTIVSDIGPFRELAAAGNAKSECCLFADPESPAEFAEKMCLLLADGELANRMATAGYEHAKNWSVQHGCHSQKITNFECRLTKRIFL